MFTECRNSSRKYSRILIHGLLIVFFFGCALPAWSEPKPKPLGKVYRVAEIFKLLQDQPARFKGKTIRIRAQHLDGVQGSGCQRYDIFVDPDHLAEYQRRNDPAASKDQQATVLRVPVILTVPDQSAVKGLYPTVAGIYEGHFFDEELSGLCPDGWQRFVITLKIEEIQLPPQNHGQVK